VTRAFSHPTIRFKEICGAEGMNERCIGHKKMTAGVYTWVDFLLLSIPRGLEVFLGFSQIVYDVE